MLIAVAQSLAELRKAITDKELDELKWPHETYDSVSCRFLRARKFEVAPTIEMMRNALISFFASQFCRSLQFLCSTFTNYPILTF